MYGSLSICIVHSEIEIRICDDSPSVCTYFYHLTPPKRLDRSGRNFMCLFVVEFSRGWIIKFI